MTLFTDCDYLVHINALLIYALLSNFWISRFTRFFAPRIFTFAPHRGYSSSPCFTGKNSTPPIPHFYIYIFISKGEADKETNTATQYVICWSSPTSRDVLMCCRYFYLHHGQYHLHLHHHPSSLKKERMKAAALLQRSRKDHHLSVTSFK